MKIKYNRSFQYNISYTNDIFHAWSSFLSTPLIFTDNGNTRSDII